MTQAHTYYPWSQQGGRLSNLAASGGQVYQNLSYTYDDNGNIESITDAVANETLNFIYNALNRLDLAAGAYNDDPAYDTVTGNIASRNGVTYSYDPKHAHAVASTSNGNSYVYYENGNMKTRNVSGQSYSLVYDKENRLTSISGGGSNARYGYDGDGKRVIAVENGFITIYIGDYFEAELGASTTYPVVVPELVQGELPHKLYLPVIQNSVGTGGGAPQVGPGFYLTHPITPNQQSITWRMYYYAEGRRVALRTAKMPAPPNPYPAPPAASSADGNLFTRLGAFLNELLWADTVSAAPLAVEAPVGEVYFLLSDHLGSTTVTLNVDGSIKAEMRYGAWGNTRYTSGTSPTDRKYTGQIEEASGLYFYNARWYDPYLSHWVQPDSIVSDPFNPQDHDRYSYTRHNPLRYSDLTGHAVTCMNDDLSTGCAGTGLGDLTPSQILNTNLPSAAQDRAIYNYSLTHPEYNYVLDPELEDTGRFLVSNAIFIGNADAVYRHPNFIDRIKSSWATFASGCSLAMAGIIAGGDSGKPEIALHNGMRLNVNDALDAATQFLGEGYIEVEPGRFVSKDGLRQVRMLDVDILGKHGGGPHMNFETWEPRLGAPGRYNRVQDLHIYLEQHD